MTRCPIEKSAGNGDDQQSRHRQKQAPEGRIAAARGGDSYLNWLVSELCVAMRIS